ncbi:MAG: arsenate reductase [Desulfobulbaceae bacterium DB1]|nr:MAG: arsenate reductase [Desulfobulbaceae bacterium DB1]
MLLKKTVLFLCTGNSCRSQMAEGWGRALHGHRYDFSSAGIEKHGLNRMAVTVMAEAGVDISGHHSKTIEDLPARDFDFVITVCGHADENCPFFPARTKVIHHGFPDPPQLAQNARSPEEALACYRTVRDLIHDFVSTLPAALEDEGDIT